MQQVPTLTVYLGHANYVGPKWETGDVLFQAFDDHGMQEMLVGSYTDMNALVADVAATRAQLVAAGPADYRPVAYEGGPSGYYINGAVTQTAISELYGKSLGIAVSALDNWLYSSLNGCVHQEYYAFNSGVGWTSHTLPRAGGFRCHSGWLALMLRNRYAPGAEMLETTFTSVPGYEREGEDIPLLWAYTIRGEDTLSVFLLSRKLGGVHDGADFGDDTTPVTLHLPITQCASLTRYALTAPDGALVVGPETGGVAGGMPEGTVYFYVFDQAVAAEAHTLTVNTVGQGAVMADPPGSTIVMPGGYAPGTVVTLAAQPAAGWTVQRVVGQPDGQRQPRAAQDECGPQRHGDVFNGSGRVPYLLTAGVASAMNVTSAEVWIQVLFTLMGGLGLFGYALWSGVAWTPFQAVLAALVAVDVVGGIVTNATSTAKRWYHRAGQGFRQHFGFVALHLAHIFLVAWLFRGMDWGFFGLASAYLLGATLIILKTPLYLQRPVALFLFALSIPFNRYGFFPTAGLEWFIPFLFLKLLVSHVLKEEPYRPALEECG
ncbi:MAG: hypothetical protein JXA21_09105 [Anaerolineae bacterium]|nr:hypothetical protein [Anaerolineae bacterium]